ncbi:hypothetical protein ACW9YQ_17010 (plasmid) [Paraburkholderia strydomiana]
MDILTSSTVAGTGIERIKKLAAKYMVARNFSSRGLDDAKALRCWERVVACVADAAAQTNEPVAQIVDELADNLGKIFPDARGRSAPTLLSAASKFLWFSGRLDVRIYDKRAVNALNTLRSGGARADGRRGWRVNGSYENFAQAWGEEYAAREKILRSAVTALGDALVWSIVPDGDERSGAMKIMKKPWFRDRVFDKYLWTIGSEDESNAGSFI